MYNVLIPTLFGRGSVGEVGVKARGMGCARLLLVYDATLPEALIGAVKKSLKSEGLEYVCFNNVLPDLPDYTVKEACEIALASNGVDGIIGLGGGSAMDTAKCVNLMLNNPWPMSQYYVVNGGQPKNSGFPLILIPTTAGTGAENTVAAVVTDTKEDIKRPVMSMGCHLATLAIIDPELSASMPPKLTAITGYDAFSHAFESYTSDDKFVTPVTDALALDAMRTIVKYLPMVLAEPDRIEYREKMAYAANLAGVTIGNAHAHKGHSFGHAIGSFTHAPHGVAIASTLPIIARHITPAYFEKTKKVVTDIFGLKIRDDITAEELGVVIHDALRDFEKAIGCPTIKDYGATREQVMTASSLILVDGLFRSGNAPMSDEGCIETLGGICDYFGLE